MKTAYPHGRTHSALSDFRPNIVAPLDARVCLVICSCCLLDPPQWQRWRRAACGAAAEDGVGVGAAGGVVVGVAGGVVAGVPSFGVHGPHARHSVPSVGRHPVGGRQARLEAALPRRHRPQVEARVGDGLRC